MIREPGDAPAIRTRGLARSFADTAAVESLDLVVGKGEMFGLVGPDGAGKTTAIRLLCGVLRPTGGEAQVLGFDLSSQVREIKSRVGYLSQGFTLYGDLTVDENIEFFAELHGLRNYRAWHEELLAFTRMSPFRTRLARALSGGMKKKLALACTLIHTPELIFLDEPSTGVDPVSRGEFWNILSEVRDRGVTVFMTTPYVDEAERCSRVGLMHRGRMLMVGTADEIRSSLPGLSYDLHCARAPGAHRQLRAAWPSVSFVLYGDRLHFRTARGEADAREISDWLNRNAFGPVTVERVEPSLEDVFVGLLDQEPSKVAAAAAGLEGGRT